MRFALSPTVRSKWIGWQATCHYFKSEFDAAIRHNNSAPELCPDAVSPSVNLAHIYSCCPDPKFHDGPMAVWQATKACVFSNGKNWLAWQALASSYLRNSEFELASRVAGQSMAMATESQRPRVTALIECVQRMTAFTTSIRRDFENLGHVWLPTEKQR